jgi:hypothetical protein
MNFSAPWGKDVKWTTWGVTAFLLAIGAIIWVAQRRSGLQEGASVPYIVVLFSLLLIGAAYAFSPRGYRVTASHIEVCRPIGPVRIPLAEVREVRRIGKKEMGGALRVAGSGGFFGYYGAYRNRALGSFKMYATDLSRSVLLSGKRRIVVSPDRPETFVEVVQSCLGVSHWGRVESKGQ